MDFNWRHLLRTATSLKSLLKTFYYNSNSTKKVKDFQKLLNKEIYFILQSNSSKYNKPLKFISFFIQFKLPRREPYSQFRKLGKTFTDCFKKCSVEYIFSSTAIHRMGNVPNIVCPRCKV